jgi:hypothetical protein
MVVACSGSAWSQNVYSCEEVEFWGDRSGEELFAVGGLAVDHDNLLYVTDSFDYSVKVFTPGRGLTGRFGRRGSGPQEFSYPYAIAIHGGKLAVVDIYSQQVQLFAPDRKDVQSLRSSPSPFDVGFDGLGNIWISSVTVSSEERVVAYDTSGRRIRSIAVGTGDTRKYLLEAVLLATNGSMDKIALATVFANRISVYDIGGRIIGSFPVSDLPDHADIDQEYRGEILPVRDVIKDITVDQKGNLYILGGTQGPHPARDVYIMSLSGHLKGRVLLPYPSSLIAIDEAGCLYTTSDERTRIRKYRLKPDHESH